jgi:phosphoheptose isomerase
MMRKAAEILQTGIADAMAIFGSLQTLAPQVEQAADAIADCLTNGKKLLVCGNGGSAADAADFCTELSCRFENDRRPYPAMNLAQGGSLITAIGNDYGFEEVFARQVRAFAAPGDLLIGVTTSGNSKNVRRALEEAKARKLKTIALLGRDGGSSRGIADIDLLIPGKSTARIQEAHKFLLHILCQIVEERIARA